MKTAMFMLIFALLVLPVASLAGSTQQYNKILLSPYYYDAILKNTYAYFNVTVAPPDRIAEVSSAIINIQTYVTSSPQDFVLQWNNDGVWSSCDNPSWRGTSSGFAVATFGCINAITKAGKYEFRLTSAKDIGSTAGWLDLTYMNSPAGSMEFHGTDYFQGEMGNIFLQLSDANDDAINNATCFFTMRNFTAPFAALYSDTPMLYINGSSGLYIYSFSIPAKPGVYPVAAKCSYYTSNNVFYGEGSFEEINITVHTGVYYGDSSNLNSYQDSLYTRHDSTAGAQKTANATYRWDNITAANATSMQFYYLGESTQTNTIIFSILNQTSGSYIQLGSLTYGGSASVATGTAGINVMFSSDVPDLNNTVKNSTAYINAYSSGGVTFTLYHNWMAFYATSLDAIIVEVKGSSEVHIFPSSVNLTVGINASQVWDYPSRSLTDYNNSQSFALLSELNATSGFMLANITEMLLLVQEINATQGSQTSYLIDINDTVYMNKASLAALLVLATAINATTLQNLGLLVEVNGTVYTSANTLSAVYGLVDDANATVYLNKQNLLDAVGLSQEINSTVWLNNEMLADVNGTLYANKDALVAILGLVNDTNMTVYMGQSTLDMIFSQTTQINQTALQNLGLLQDANGTLYMNKATLNVLLGLANETNSTAYLNWLLLNSINSTSNYVQVRVDQMNLTVDQVHSLLGTVNANVVVNGVGITSINNKVTSLVALAQAINMTTEQIYDLLYNLSIGNVTVTAIVNNTAIAEAVWNADVEEFQVSPASVSFPVTGAAAARGLPILGGVAFAAPSDAGVNAVCVDNQTLMNFVVRTRCVNNVCNTIQTNATIQCQYGCNSGEVPNSCNPSPGQANLYIAVFIIVMIIALGIAVKKYA